MATTTEHSWSKANQAIKFATASDLVKWSLVVFRSRQKLALLMEPKSRLFTQRDSESKQKQAQQLVTEVALLEIESTQSRVKQSVLEFELDTNRQQAEQNYRE